MEQPETLEALRRQLAPAIADAAVFDGWTMDAVRQAAGMANVDPALAEFAFRDGQMAMISAWVSHVDEEMARTTPASSLQGVSIRERIRRLVMARLDAVAGREEALNRALTIMAMPQNLRTSLRLGWHSADAMWRLAGDTATDYNHYSKRAILGSVYAATMAVFLNDDSAGFADTRAFLGRRIDAVMRFEAWKHRRAARGIERPSLARFVGRLRYPGR